MPFFVGKFAQTVPISLRTNQSLLINSLLCNISVNRLCASFRGPKVLFCLGCGPRLAILDLRSKALKDNNKFKLWDQILHLFMHLRNYTLQIDVHFRQIIKNLLSRVTSLSRCRMVRLSRNITWIFGVWLLSKYIRSVYAGEHGPGRSLTGRGSKGQLYVTFFVSFTTRLQMNKRNFQVFPPLSLWNIMCRGERSAAAVRAELKERRAAERRVCSRSDNRTIQVLWYYSRVTPLLC